MKSLPSITTPRIVLEILGPEDAYLMVAYYAANRAHLAPWEPLRSEEFFSLDHWRELLRDSVESFHAGTALKLSALAPDRSEVLGVCNFTNISYGPFMACNLGYSIASEHEGQGLMYEIVEAGIRYVFAEVGLHRVMANYIPSNQRSEALLKRLGFEREGYARSYMQIAGRWQDHVLTAKMNETFSSTKFSWESPSRTEP